MGSSAGTKDVALPQGDSAPNCATPASTPEGATQFWCLLCGSQRCRHAGKAKFRRQTGLVLHTRAGLALLRELENRCHPLPHVTAALRSPRCRSESVTKSLGIKLPLNAIWEMGKKKKANPHSFSAIVGNENGYCCLVESPIMNNVCSLPAQRMKGIRAGGDILRPEM